MEVAQGNIPFYEKNLQEVIRGMFVPGRLIYSADPEELARKAQVIFLAEDSAQSLEQLVLRLRGAAGAFQVLSIVTPVSVGSIALIGKSTQSEKSKKPTSVPADVLHQWMRGRRFQLARPDHSRNDFQRSGIFAETYFPSAGDARRSRDGDESRHRRTGSRSDDRICGHKNFIHQ